MSHKTWSRGASVWNIFGGWWKNFIGWFISVLIFVLDMSYTHFFRTCLVGMPHTFFGYASFIIFYMPFEHVATFFGCTSFISFHIALILESRFGERERVMIKLEDLFYEWMEMLAICECTCTWSWSWVYDKSLTRVKEFDQTQSKVKLHMKVLAWTSMFGFGRISLIWGDKLLMIFLERNHKYFAKKSMIPFIQSYHISHLLR